MLGAFMSVNTSECLACKNKHSVQHNAHAKNNLPGNPRVCSSTRKKFHREAQTFHIALEAS